jgi:hypothetical protein
MRTTPDEARSNVLPGTQRITTDTDISGTMCDQCMEAATHRVLLDGFPLYLVCAGHVERVQGFITAQLIEDGAAPS